MSKAMEMTARLIAKQRGIDIETLFHILSWKRPYRTDGEREFIELFCDGIIGMSQDLCGNRFLLINNPDGTKPKVIWSCHTDTVSAKDGRQNLRWQDAGNVLGLNEGKTGQCLGADDGAGMWLMLEMIKVNKPGLYIFHRGEERGGIGSGFIKERTPELIQGYDMAIAFDRRATHSIITRQRGGRCCSDAFADSLAKELMKVPGTKFQKDTGGTFTDTANYTRIIPECTNVSVGYYSEHSSRETLDIGHLIRLRDCLLQLDVSNLVIKRDPSEVETYTYTRYSTPANTSWQKSQVDQKAKKEAARYEAWLESHPCDGGGSNIPAKPVREYPSTWTKYPSTPSGVSGTTTVSAVGSGTPTNKPEPINKASPAIFANEEDSFKKLLALIERWPEAVATFFLGHNFDEWDLADHILEEQGLAQYANVHMMQAAVESLIDDPDQDLPEVDEDENELAKPIECQNCYTKVPLAEVDETFRCPYCYGNLLDSTNPADATLKQDILNKVVLADQDLVDAAQPRPILSISADSAEGQKLLRQASA